MKYFVGYLIEGEASAWHRNLARYISNRFNTWKIYEKVPPHLTIYRPFQIDNINKIKLFLSSWTKEHTIPGDFVLSGFDHFNDKVVFANIKTDHTIIKIIEELRGSLHQLIMSSAKEDLLPWHPHATLANKLTPQEIKQIWEYVLTVEKPAFVMPFDNITIFRFENDQKWIVEELFRLSVDI